MSISSTAPTVALSPGPDRAGIAISALCAVHCLAAPFVLVFLPAALVPIVEAEWLEWALIGCTALAGGTAIVALGWRAHRRPLPVILFLVGIALLVGSRFEFVEALVPEAVFVAAGAALVIGAHGYNRVCSTRCVRCADGPACA